MIVASIIVNNLSFRELTDFSYCHSGVRFGKSTHIYMISNSVTHLQSYMNSAIADITRNSTRVPISLHRMATVLWCFTMFEECFIMFHNVLSISWCLTSGSRCFTTFHDVSEWFTNVSWCFTMFNESRNDRHHVSVTTWLPITSGIATTPQGSAITPQKSAMTLQGSLISLGKWSHTKLRPEWRLE